MGTAGRMGRPTAPGEAGRALGAWRRVGGGHRMTTHTPDDGTDLGTILAAAAGLPDYRRRTIEPVLTAREAAAERFSAATAQLVIAWRELAERSQALQAALEAEQIKLPLAALSWGR